jgi:hypothetical protein
MGEDRGGGEKKLTSPLTLTLSRKGRGELDRIRGGKRKREKVKRKQRKVF